MRENVEHELVPEDLTSGLAATFHRTVQHHCHRLAGIAQSEWERRFAGREPSDDCVSVRIWNPRRRSLGHAA